MSLASFWLLILQWMTPYFHCPPGLTLVQGGDSKTTTPKSSTGGGGKGGQHLKGRNNCNFYFQGHIYSHPFIYPFPSVTLFSPDHLFFNCLALFFLILRSVCTAQESKGAFLTQFIIRAYSSICNLMSLNVVKQWLLLQPTVLMLSTQNGKNCTADRPTSHPSLLKNKHSFLLVLAVYICYTNCTPDIWEIVRCYHFILRMALAWK